MDESFRRTDLFENLVNIHSKVAMICSKLASEKYKYTHKFLKSDTLTVLIIPLCYKYGEASLEDAMNIVVSHLVRVKLLTKRHPQYNWFEYVNAFNTILTKAYTANIPFQTVCNDIRSTIWNKSVVYFQCETYEQFAQKIKDLPVKVKNNNAITKFILGYYVEHTKTKVIKVNICEADLEHIAPQSSYDKADSEQNRLGNCTLLEARNTDKQKGNRSIQDTSFDKKKQSYNNSCLKINNEIVTMFPSVTKFDTACINEREAYLCNELFKITEGFLKPQKQP
jgi:hypothetical protein